MTWDSLFIPYHCFDRLKELEEVVLARCTSTPGGFFFAFFGQHTSGLPTGLTKT